MKILIITIGMFVVTYIPRMLPVIVHDKLHIPNWLENWLKSIPYAALGALIFPGIMNVSPENKAAGIVSGLVAIAIAYFEFNIAYVIASAIGVSVIILNIFN